jgi:tripeptidyl-peptidase I
MDDSHPESPYYGKYWTAQEVVDAFAPSDTTITSVVRRLEDAGITPDRAKQSRGLNCLHAYATVLEAENLLQATCYQYIHTSTGQTHIAYEENSIQEDFQTYVDFIMPTVQFDKISSLMNDTKWIAMK